METLKITRLGEPQNKSGVSQKTGKPYNFNVIGFQAEGKDGWFNFNYNGEENAHGLEIGKEYDFVLTSREYNGKTYWSAAHPKKEDKLAALGEETAKEINRILMELTPMKLILQEILSYVKPRTKSHQELEEGIDIDETPF